MIIQELPIYFKSNSIGQIFDLKVDSKIDNKYLASGKVILNFSAVYDAITSLHFCNCHFCKLNNVNLLSIEFLQNFHQFEINYINANNEVVFHKIFIFFKVDSFLMENNQIICNDVKIFIDD